MPSPKSKRKIDYQQKDLKNPFFQKKGKAKVKKWMIFILVIVILAIALRFLVNSPIFLIKNIEIYGTKTISKNEILNIYQDQLEKHRFFILPQNNIFFFDKDRLEKKIEDKYILQDLEISKKYLDTIIIELEETITSVVYLTRDQAYYLDLKGQVISEVKSFDESDNENRAIEVLRNRAVAENLPVIYNEENIEVKIGDSVVASEVIEFIIELNEKLTEANIAIDYFQINPENNKEVWAKTSVGYEIYFSRDLEIISQIQNLTVVLEEKIKNPADLEYIDLRFGQKVFYK